MVTAVKANYPASSTQAITISLASLASSSDWTAGRASTAVDNTTNLDLDALVSGVIKTGTTPTDGTVISVYAYAYRSIASGTPTYPDSITGTDAAKTMTSANVLQGTLRLMWSQTVDATTGRNYEMPPTSVCQALGVPVLPPFWGIYVAHNNGAALDATGGNHSLVYERIQVQNV